MALYLAQHGVALPTDQDPEKGLSEQGRADTRRIAEVAAGYGVTVGRIEHSGKKRARQTAEIFAELLAPAGGVATRDGLGAKDDVAPVASAIDPADDLMLVGHLPFMERLVGLLVAGDADTRVFAFQNGGIVCLDRQDDGWLIRWSLSPHIDP
jgi:phosphohistidine phosphatase